MTTNNSTSEAEGPLPVTELIDIRDHLLDLHDAHSFVGEAVFELLKSDEAEPNTHGLHMVLRDLRSRGRNLLNEIDALIDKQKSTAAKPETSTASAREPDAPTKLPNED